VTLLAITAIGIYGQSRFANAGTRYATVTGKGYAEVDASWALALRRGCVLRFLCAAGDRPAVPGSGLVVVAAFFTACLRWLRSRISPSTIIAPCSITECRDGDRQQHRACVLDCDAGDGAFGRRRLDRAAHEDPGRVLLDTIASLPLAIPGIVVGLAIMIAYLALPIGIYGTIWILLIAYMTRFLPYGMRFSAASLVQVHKELRNPRLSPAPIGQRLSAASCCRC